MSAALHIPMCNNPGCEAQLKQLSQTFTHLGNNVEDDKRLNGRFSCQFKENLNKCPFTILHYCEHLWLKIKNHKDILTLTKELNNKLICVHLKKRLSGDKKTFGEASFHDFFHDFNLINLTTDQDIRKFAYDVFLSLQRCHVGTQQTDAEIPVKLMPRAHVRMASESAPPGSYVNEPLAARQFFERMSFLYQQVAEMEHVREESFVKYPDVNVYMFVPTAYIRLESYTAQNFPPLIFTKMNDFHEFKECVRLLRNEDTFNVSFFLNKVIPELYNESCALGLAIVATSQHCILAERSVSMLELLLFRGQLRPGFNTIDDLQGVQLELCNLISQLSQSLSGRLRQRSSTGQTNKDDLIKRTCNLIVLIQLENLMKCAKKDNWLDYTSFNSDLSNILSSCKQSDYTKTCLKTLDVLLGKLTNKQHKTIQSVLHQNTVEELVLLAKEFWGKELPLTLVYVFQCLKKLFKNRDLKIVEVLGDCLQMKSRLPIGQVSVHPVVSAILFRGLSHFVTFCLREACHTRIHEICGEVMKLIDSTSKQQSPNEIRQLQQALIFDPSPDIRTEIIKLLGTKGVYEECIESFLVNEIENLLCPYLSIDPTLPSPSSEMSLLGKFQQTPVIVFVHKPRVTEHWGDRMYANDRHDQHHKIRLAKITVILKQLDHDNILKLFAYRLRGIPQFYISEYYPTNLQEFLTNRNVNRRYCKEKILLSYVVQTCSALDYCHEKNIVHCNLTAASLFLAGEEQVKLGKFHIAVKLTDLAETVLEDTSIIPTRWSAPETLRSGIVSKSSDIAMFGNLMYEILSHGVLPHFRENPCDQEFVSQAIYLSQLHRETCFTDEQYSLMQRCTHYCPTRRPSVVQLMMELQEIVHGNSTEDSLIYVYPDLQHEFLKPSTEYKRGIPKIKYSTVVEQMTDTLSPRLEKTIDENLQQYRVGQFLLFKETVHGHFFKNIISHVQRGDLDSVVPRINIENMGNRNTFLISVFLPGTCSGDILSLIEKKQLCDQPKSFTELILKVAEMLKSLHEQHFVLGELKASHVYVDQTGESLKVYPISFKNLNYIRRSHRPRTSGTNEDTFHMSQAKDVYMFGKFVMEVLHKVESLISHEENYESIDYQIYGFQREDKCPGSVYNIISQCLRKNHQDRPPMDDVIRTLFYEVNEINFLPSTVSTPATSISNVDIDGDGEGNDQRGNLSSLSSCLHRIKAFQNETLHLAYGEETELKKSKPRLDTCYSIVETSPSNSSRKIGHEQNRGSSSERYMLKENKTSLDVYAEIGSRVDLSSQHNYFHISKCSSSKLETSSSSQTFRPLPPLPLPPARSQGSAHSSVRTFGERSQGPDRSYTISPLACMPNHLFTPSNTRGLISTGIRSASSHYDILRPELDSGDETVRYTHVNLRKCSNLNSDKSREWLQSRDQQMHRQPLDDDGYLSPYDVYPPSDNVNDCIQNLDNATTKDFSRNIHGSLSCTKLSKSI
uniref:Protein kinase domain-containing protein n=1 Tax=Biomphalaria glabrata TaxID=6526 RepID=A0A2C9K0C1_BIOGL